MASINRRQLRILEPYLESLEPTHTHKDGTREINMICPLHEDDRRSASINVDKGVFYCQAGCGGMRIVDLIRRQSEWVPPATVKSNGRGLKRGAAKKQQVILSEAMFSGWHSALLSNESALRWLKERRGLELDTIRRYEIGFKDERLYTIPVRGPEGEIWNVRYYNPNPSDINRKIWSESGYGSPPRLYPISIFKDDPEEIIVGGGEWDILLTLQNGYDAVTRTGAEDVWRTEWNEHFAGRVVYLAHDSDHKGQTANAKIARYLAPFCDVRIVELPYPVVPKHGPDLTDFQLEHDPKELRALLDGAKKYERRKRGVSQNGKVETVHVLDTFDAKRVGKPVKVVVTIKGRKEPGYVIPRKVRLVCTQDAGNKCNSCPMMATRGEAEVTVDREDPLVLSLIDAPTESVEMSIAGSYGVPGAKCQRLRQEVEEHQSVEILFARPALDNSNEDTDVHKSLRIVSVGRHDTSTNLTVAATGALHPSPRSQANEFLAQDLEVLQTSVDKFEMNPETLSLMRRFQTQGNPLKKIAQINKSLSEHVTRISGRPEMHALMDLTLHSALMFPFAGELVTRGWIESLIIGDTGTGKSTAAKRLVAHYGAGEIVNCEAATFAGIVGGVQQLGGKDWVVTWGTIPINDRRAVILDEISGLSLDDISSMSDVRSSGQARLTKIVQEITWARTRLIWMGNPRNSTMERFTYGVDALPPLIGNAEDVARFDLAMAVTKHDVPSEEINVPAEGGEMLYTPEACHALLMWAWSRKPDDITWENGAEEYVLDKANELGKLYVEEPPLILASSVRIKIARVAVAIACRLFSCDATRERVRVKKVHVDAAVQFINVLYGMQVFGYAERSRQYMSDQVEAEEAKEEIKDYLETHTDLAKYLRSGVSKFRRQDLEEILNVSREMANSVINTLWSARMIRKELGDIRVQPTLHALLREINP